MDKPNLHRTRPCVPSELGDCVLPPRRLLIPACRLYTGEERRLICENQLQDVLRVHGKPSAEVCASKPARGGHLQASAARRLSAPDALSLLRPRSASRGPQHL